MASFKKLQDAIALKLYQYELTIGLYMLEPWEKTLFNLFVLLMFFLATYTAYAYLPDYTSYIIAKGQYYLSPIELGS
ncbi:hypothetical protein HK098_006416 [Nowakowskiella sp. JEL0407]|nr:hypothetical protein HK098_006416 [Nowakowskiella sp. JEL0407]